jgi:uncharacterized protein YndB with AHSA1/START domain
MRDLIGELAATHRDVSRRTVDGTEQIVVGLRRQYPADVEDVWDAVTDPDRLARWMLPVSGDLRVGGAFQLEGNVGGEILECERPTGLAVTWGAPVSVVRLRLSAGAAGTELVLEHSVPVEFAGSGAGGLYVGPGWDISVLGLALFLRGDVVVDPAAWESTPEVQRFSEAAITSWAETIRAGRTATDDEVAAATEAARAQFTPDLVAAPAAEA